MSGRQRNCLTHLSGDPLPEDASVEGRLPGFGGGRQVVGRQAHRQQHNYNSHRGVSSRTQSNYSGKSTAYVTDL